jgi:hypothetical protein
VVINSFNKENKILEGIPNKALWFSPNLHFALLEVQNGIVIAAEENDDANRDPNAHRPSIRAAQSHQLINRVAAPSENANQSAGGILQRFFSIGDQLNVECGKRGGGISVSTGYLNVRDVFYPGSITGLSIHQASAFI